MKKILNSGLVLTLLALGPLSVNADTLYISDVNGTFGSINLSNIGTASPVVSVIGSFVAPGSTTPIVMRDLGWTANGSLYGETYSSLYAISTVTGISNQLTPTNGLGSVGGGYVNGLVGDRRAGQGANLIATSYATKGLYAVDVSGASFTTSALSGSLTGNTNGDLTFGSDGAIYDILTTGVLDKVTVSGNSYTTVAVGTATFGGKAVSVNGMVTETNGTILAISGTNIYTVDTNTAALSLLYNYASAKTTLGSATGAAIYNASLVVVPEPGNVALLLLGLAGLFYFQRRRSLANLT